MDLQNLGVNNVYVQSENGQNFVISLLISELFFGSNCKDNKDNH